MKSLPQILAAAIILGGVSLLTGCSGARYADLDNFIAEVHARPKPPIPPLPEFKAYEFFAYGAGSLRNPFEPPAPPRPPRPAGQDAEIKPDPNRVKGPLESFSISDLSMVGTLEQDGRFHALISDGDSVHRVMKGNYMGRDHGQILEITEASIELDELVSDGFGGWVKRSRTVLLTSSDQ